MIKYFTSDKLAVFTLDFKKPALIIAYTLCYALYSFSGAQDNGQWKTDTTSDASSPESRHENAYVKVGDKFYLLGSRGIKKVQIYDPVAKTWTNGPNVPLQMHHFQAVEFNGKIYVVCGFTGGYPHETPLTNVYIFDPSTNAWTTGPEIPEARRRGSAGVVVYNNKIYVVAGIIDGHTSGHVNWFDEFDPVAETWTILPDAPRARDHFHAAVVGSKIVVAGGRTSSHPSTFNFTVSEVDVYDFTTGAWTTLANNIPTPRAGAAVAVLGNEVLVIGGESMANLEAHAETEAVNVTTGNWRSLAMLNVGRHGTQAIVYKDSLYIVAGSKQRGGNGSTELTSQEIFFFKDPTVIQDSKNAVNKMFLIAYPNPGENTITLQTEDQENNFNITILNSYGELVRQLKSFGTSEIVMGIEELPQGIYYITVESVDSKRQGEFKIVKK